MRILNDNPLEDDDQVAAACYLDLLTSPAGDGKLFWFHTPNGGFRNKKTAGKMKAQGVKKGIPDIIIEEIPPKFPEYKGVRIELKRRKGRPSDVKKEQREILDRYKLRGYLVFVCFGIDDVIATLRKCGFA